MATAPVKKVPIHLQSSQNRLLIKNGRVVNDDGMEDADVYIEDGIIKQVGRNLIIPGGTRTIDATGKLVMPGGIDPHTHFELEMMGAKTVDDFYKGTRAAVAGGTTTVIDFVLPEKGQSLVEAYNNWRQKADGKVCCDYGLHVGVTWWSPSVRKDMERLVSEFGVNSFKMFMAYKDAWMLDDYHLMCAMEACAELRALPQSNDFGVNSFKMFMAYKDAWMLDDYHLMCAMEACAELRALPQSNDFGVNSFKMFMAYKDAWMLDDYHLMCAMEACAELRALPQSNDFGVNSFKMFMAYKDAWMLDDYHLMCAMEACAELRALPQVHAENGHIIARNTEKLLVSGVTGPEGHERSRDEEVEGEAVNRACVIANQVNSPLYIVHMMSKSAVRALQQARARQRQPLYGETLAATVGTDGSHYRNSCFRHAAAHVLSPPLRPDPSTPQAIVEALAE
ncbi:dihydropyrimidinase-like [Cydia amplana]|uniref:dihydropyrimidinase-like n=1 Tax=Cydia amplana TaxID=1869771 RepID=UPI002FE6549F